MASPASNPFDDIAPPPAPLMVTPELASLSIVAAIRRFIAVDNRLDAIEAEQATLKQEKAALSNHVIELMIEEGMDTPPGVDGMTAYLKSTPYVEKNIDPETGQPFTSEDIHAALRDSGLGGLIKSSYHGGQLRSTLKEYFDNGGEPPAALTRVVTLKKNRQLAVTPMAATKRKTAPDAGI